jgi:hypothetical protein
MYLRQMIYHALLNLRTTIAVCVNALVHSKPGTRPVASLTDCDTSIAVLTGLAHHSLHQIARHVDHNLHGTVRDAAHGHSRPLEDGVQCSSDVLVA